MELKYLSRMDFTAYYIGCFIYRLYFSHPQLEHLGTTKQNITYGI